MRLVMVKGYHLVLRVPILHGKVKHRFSILTQYFLLCYIFYNIESFLKLHVDTSIVD